MQTIMWSNVVYQIKRNKDKNVLKLWTMNMYIIYHDYVFEQQNIFTIFITGTN